jgi:hypothetical protein
MLTLWVFDGDSIRAKTFMNTPLRRIRGSCRFFPGKTVFR